jgi:hypothetical protein
MHEAALRANEDPDRPSFLPAVRVVQRRLPRCVSIPPRQTKVFHEAILQESVMSSRSRVSPRGVKRMMNNYPLRSRKRQRTRRIDFGKRIKIVK